MSRAGELDTFQSRLELRGWEFCSKHFDRYGYHWRAYKRMWGMCETFTRTDRDDARAQCLQWAEMTEAAVNEDRPTIPAPAMGESNAAE